MPLPKFIYRNPVTGQNQENLSTEVFDGTAGQAVLTNPQGYIDPSLIPGIDIVETNTGTGTTLFAGNWVYIGSDGNAYLACAAPTGSPAAVHEAEGYVLADSSAGSPCIVYFAGVNVAAASVSEQPLGALTVGAREYLSTTPGMSQETPVTGAGNIHQLLGYAGPAIYGSPAVSGVDYEFNDSLLLAS